MKTISHRISLGPFEKADGVTWAAPDVVKPCATEALGRAGPGEALAAGAAATIAAPATSAPAHVTNRGVLLMRENFMRAPFLESV
jgi:hypothetical protein